MARMPRRARWWTTSSRSVVGCVTGSTTLGPQDHAGHEQERAEHDHLDTVGEGAAVVVEVLGVVQAGYQRQAPEDGRDDRKRPTPLAPGQHQQGHGDSEELKAEWHQG